MRAYIFDMDGLLFDTEKVYKDIFNSVAGKWNLELPGGYYDSFIGIPDREFKIALVRDFGSSLDVDRFFVAFRRVYDAAIASGTPYKKGFPAFFLNAKERGIKTAIATSSTRDTVQKTFGALDPAAVFDVITTADDITKGKPDPQVYEITAQKLDTDKADILVFEDSNQGVLAGVSAGLKVVMIPDLVLPNEFSKQNAWKIIGSIEDLHEANSKRTFGPPQPLTPSPIHGGEAI